jgi:hypothetical protein
MRFPIVPRTVVNPKCMKEGGKRLRGSILICCNAIETVFRWYKVKIEIRTDGLEGINGSLSSYRFPSTE